MTSVTFAKNATMADGGGGSETNIATPTGDNQGLYDKYFIENYQMDQLDSLDKTKEGYLDQYCNGDGWIGKIGSVLSFGMQKASGLCVGNSIVSGAADLKNTFDNLISFSWAFNFFAKMIWDQYLVIAFFFIKVVSWAFSLEIITYLKTAFDTAMSRLQTTIWDPFMYLMWAVSVCWLVYFWISGKKTKLWTTFTNSLIIIALSSTLFANLGNYLQTLSNASTYTSVTILSGLSDLNAPSYNPNAPNSQQQAYSAMESSLAGIFLKLPFQMVEFGSMDFANANNFQPPKGNLPSWFPTSPTTTTTGQSPSYHNWSLLLTLGSDMNSRREVIQNAYAAEKDDNAKKKYLWFLPDEAVDRFVTTSLSTAASFAGLCCFLYISILTIIWQFIAIGRGLLAALYLLMGLWPGYGMKEAAQWAWSLVQAMFMKVFYTIILAVYINMIAAIADEADSISINAGSGFFNGIIGALTVWLLAVGVFIGLMLALKDLRQKLTNIPLGNGMFLKGATNEAEQVFDKVKEMGQKGLGYGTAIAGAATGNPALAKAGLSMTKGFGHMMQQEGKQRLGAFAEKREEKKERKNATEAADAAFENRLAGLSEEDKQFAEDIYDKTGIDLTTQQGRQAYTNLVPDARNNAAVLDRIQENADEVELKQAASMAQVMPSKIPAKGTAEYADLAKRVGGAENIELWRQEYAKEIDRVNNSPEMARWNALPKAQQLVTAKPNISMANIQNGFEKQFIAQQTAAMQAAATIAHTPSLQSVTVPMDIPVSIKAAIQSQVGPNVNIDWGNARNQIESKIAEAQRQFAAGLKPKALNIQIPSVSGSVNAKLDLNLIQKELGSDINKDLQSFIKTATKGSSDASIWDKSADKMLKEFEGLQRNMQLYPGQDATSFSRSKELQDLGLAGNNLMEQLKDFMNKVHIDSSGTDAEDIETAKKAIKRLKEFLKNPPTPPSGGGTP